MLHGNSQMGAITWWKQESNKHLEQTKPSVMIHKPMETYEIRCTTWVDILQQSSQRGQKFCTTWYSLQGLETMEGPPFGKAYPLEGSQWKLKICKNETNGEKNKKWYNCDVVMLWLWYVLNFHVGIELSVSISKALLYTLYTTWTPRTF